MAQMIDAGELARHQEATLGLLARGVRCLEEGPDAVLSRGPAIRASLWNALGAYQRFKHERVFDPAVTSGDEQRAALARHMKAGCIAAGEVFRVHMGRWGADAIVADWDRYRVAARLTTNQLRRHIVTEGEGIAELLEAYR